MDLTQSLEDVDLTITAEPRGGTVVITGVVLQAKPGKWITARSMRAANIGQALEELKSQRKAEVSPELVDSVRKWGRWGGTKPDAFYAQLCVLYLEQCQGGHAPLVKLSEILGWPYATINTRLATARRRGLLTPPINGLYGGSLTEQGKIALSEAAPF